MVWNFAADYIARIQQWTDKQTADARSSMDLELVSREVHAPARKPKHFRQIVVSGLWDTIMSDGADYAPFDVGEFAGVNSGWRKLVVFEDAFSRYAWAFPQRGLTAAETWGSFEKVLAQLPKTPRYFNSDGGSDYTSGTFQTKLKERGIKFYASWSTVGSALPERLFQSIGGILWRDYLTPRQTRRWIDFFDVKTGQGPVMEAYNTREHRILGMSPAEVIKLDSAQLAALWTHQYGRTRLPLPAPAAQLTPGTLVRVSRLKDTPWDKGYRGHWSLELFKIDSVSPGSPPMYTLRDLGAPSELVQGRFYENEVAVSQQDPNDALVDRVLQRRTVRGVKQVYVCWAGYPNNARFNSWITDSDTLQTFDNAAQRAGVDAAEEAKKAHAAATRKAAADKRAATAAAAAAAAPAEPTRAKRRRGP